jgi:hypothetical protein
LKSKSILKPASRRRHSLRGSTGKFIPTTGQPEYNRAGAEGFWNWLRDYKPQILSSENRYQPFCPTQHQRESINAILAIDGQGSFKHSLSVVCEPRRHGKSTILALIILWLCCSRRNQVVQLLGNSEDHTRRTQYRTLKRIIEHTPKLSKLVPEKDRTLFEIRFQKSDSLVQLGSGINIATAFGDKINVLWVSDLHACPDLEPFNAFQASLLDSKDSLILIDSNVDFIDGPIHSLEREAQEDPSILFRAVSYRDFEHYEKEAPPWINRQKARRLERTALPTDFARDILGKRSDARNALFPANVIELCKSNYKIPVSDIHALTQGRAYKVGAGLDRAKSLIGGDNTIWSVVLKLASPQHGEPEVYLLNQVAFTLNTARAIKKQILQDHERYHLDAVTLENYETADLSPWLSDMKISHELVSAHDTNQNASFTELHRIAREGRLHFPEDLKDLASEMATFTYTARTGGQTYSFGHASSKFKDDRVYSLNWSVFSLREAVLNLYVLGHIVCKNKTPRKHLCFLMGGEMELLCKNYCTAYQEVEAMFKEYKAIRLDDDLTIQEFFETRVKLEGARISQAA